MKHWQLPEESALDVLQELRRRRIRLMVFSEAGHLWFTPKRKATVRMVARFQAHEREIRSMFGLPAYPGDGADYLKPKIVYP